MKFVKKRYFAWSLGVICAICICDMAYHYIRLHKYNQSPLNIETFDGSNSPYHPSVYTHQMGGENITILCRKLLSILVCRL